MKIRALAIAGILALSSSLAACGDDSTGDLDRGDLSAQLQAEMELDEETADCAADALIDADFTKEELEGDMESLSTEKGQAFTAALMDCMGLDLSEGDIPTD